MDVGSLYRSKLTTPDQAMVAIPSGSKLSMGMAMAEPPALLKALANRAEAGGIEDLMVYYFEATRIAGETILRYELNDRIHPYCMFISATERALIKRGVEDGGRKVINYVPNNFHQTPRLPRIVPRLEGPVTTPRIDTHYIVTEFGAVNLKGLSSTERALRLIELAHPEFRDGLMASAKELHLV
jgi:acyl-CoA hydrolase